MPREAYLIKITKLYIYYGAFKTTYFYIFSNDTSSSNVERFAGTCSM